MKELTTFIIVGIVMAGIITFMVWHSSQVDAMIENCTPNYQSQTMEC